MTVNGSLGLRQTPVATGKSVSATLLTEFAEALARLGNELAVYRNFVLSHNLTDR